MLTLTVSGQQQGSGSQPGQTGQTAQGQSQTCAMDKGSTDKGSTDKGSTDKAATGKKDAPKKGSTAAQNPFPEAQSENAAQPQDQGAQPPAPVPQTNAPAPAKKNSTADQNPFPEAESEKAAKQDQRPSPAAQQKGSDYSSSDSGLKGLRLPAPDQPAVPPASEQEDLRVGAFYLQSGDYKGAYDRFQAAAQLNPGSAEAVWGLAESERRLGMTKQAVENYQLYLMALPDGPKAKDARKALKELGAKP